MSISARRLLTARNAKRNGTGGGVIPTENLAIGKTFTSSVNAVNPLSNITDQNLTTRWISAAQDNVAVDLDLAGVYTLANLKIYWAGDCTATYSVSMSLDGTSWTQIGTGTTTGTSSAAELANFTSFSATPKGRYLRITCLTRHNASYGNSIFEVEAYGTRDTSYAIGTITSFTATKASDTKVDLAWAYSGDPLANYIVKRDGTTIATIANQATTSYSDTTVSAGNTYAYSITGTYATGGGSTNTKTASVSILSANGMFTVQGKQIIGPDGQPFLPIGVNFGTDGFCSGDPGGGNNPARFPSGRSSIYKAWGFNTVRLCFIVSDQIWGYRQIGHSYNQLLSYVYSVVDEYLAAGMVVWPEAHDFTIQSSQCYVGSTIFNQCKQFWIDVATHYKNNPYVWFNLFNEPVWSNDNGWITVQDNICGAIRGLGATNVIVIDTPNMGQDAGWNGSSFSYNSHMGPYLNNKHGNMVFAQHNYSAYQNQAALQGYYNNMWNAGLCVVHGEIGYTTNGSATAATYAENVAAGQSVFAHARANGVGFLWWNGNHGDYYQLTNSGNSDPFWTSTPGTNLSDAGQRMWNISHG